MTVQRAFTQTPTRKTNRRRRPMPRRSCYRCYSAFTCTSDDARVYCATCRRRYGFPAPDARSA